LTKLVINDLIFDIRYSMTKFSTIERIIQGLRFCYQPKHHAPQIYQVRNQFTLDSFRPFVKNVLSKGRISSEFHATPSQAFRRPPNTHTGHTHVPVPAKLANIMTTKSSQPLAPLWQELDDTFEERLRVKRRREGSGIYTARRITDRQRSAAKSNDDSIDVEQPDRPKATIRPKLIINQTNQPDNSDSDHDEPRYRPQAKIRSRKSLTDARCVVFFEKTTFLC
jgi:hypothetical protein